MSRPIDDLFKALNMFNDGMKSLQMGRVLDNANSTVEQIRNSDLDAKQKRAELKNVADQLTFKLVGLGGSVDAAKTLAGTIEPQGQPLPQNEFQAYMLAQGDPEMMKALGTYQKDKAEAESKKRMAELDEWKAKFDIGETARDINQDERQGRADQDAVLKTLNDFRDKTAKKNIEALDALTGIDGIMSIPEEERGQAALGILQRAVVKQTGDPRISDQDADAIAPDPSIASRLKRNFRLLTQGKPLEKDFAEYGLMAEMLKKANLRNLEQKAQGYAKSRSQYVRGVTADSLLEDIYTEYNIDPRGMSIKKAPVSGYAPEQLNTPKEVAPQGNTPQAPVPPSSPSWFKPR